MSASLFWHFSPQFKDYVEAATNKIGKGKGIVLPIHIMKEYKRNRFAPPLAIDLVTGWN